MAENIDSLMTEAEISKITGLDRVTLYRLRQAGKIGFFKFGKVIRYSQEHIQNFMKSNERPAKKGKGIAAGGLEK